MTTFADNSNYTHEIEMEPTEEEKEDTSLKSSQESEETSTPKSPQQLVNGFTKDVMRGPLAPLNNFIDCIEGKVKDVYKRNERTFKYCACVVFFLGYLAYLIAVCVLNFKRAEHFFYITIAIIVCVTYWAVKKFFGDKIETYIIHPIRTRVIKKYWKVIKWIIITLFFLFVIFWIIYDSVPNPKRLISVAGLFIYMLIGFLFSTNRNRIKWRPVVWGFALQFVFGLLILRTKPGYSVFKWIGDRVTIFLGFSKEGSDFLFRDLNQFAFTILPVIAYFSAFTYLLWYIGVIQVLIEKIAWLLEITMGTSPAESFNAAGNIFIGMVEAPLLIRPFLAGMTESELHAVMTGGFATIAGSVLAIYIFFGVSATHLLSASIMSAPAALAMSKLMCPEVDEPEVKTVKDIKVEKTKETNVFEAVAEGASMSIGLILNIAVNLVAFLSLLKFANAILGWLGSLAGEPRLSFEFICSYVFMPFAYIMGVAWKDSFYVAELLGVKTFLNEFVAYQRLSVFIKNRESGKGDALTLRSEVIATYALCGFANFGSMGIILGGISALVPAKRGVLAKHLVRSLIAGTLACFMTACIAGLLYEEGNLKVVVNGTMTT